MILTPHHESNLSGPYWLKPLLTPDKHSGLWTLPSPGQYALKHKSISHAHPFINRKTIWGHGRLDVLVGKILFIYLFII